MMILILLPLAFAYGIIARTLSGPFFDQTINQGSMAMYAIFGLLWIPISLLVGSLLAFGKFESPTKFSFFQSVVWIISLAVHLYVDRLDLGP